MKGNAKIIALLNSLLTGELTSIDQYFQHSEMFHDWGLSRLYERIHHEMEDEQRHAKALIERILFLEGVPNLADRFALNIGKDVKSMLQNDLALELSVVAALRKAIAECEKAEDFVSRSLLVELLEDTEHDHTHWLEQQLGLIEMVGLQNYIQSQMGTGEAQ